MTPGIDALTDKEKATLRLIVRGHDAKSTARTLALSVHTVNERLREARRKLGVSSSREAARLLSAHEDAAHQLSVDTLLGDAPRPTDSADFSESITLVSSRRPAIWLIGGFAMLSLALAILTLTPAARTSPASPPAAAATVETEAASAASRFLALIDQHRWGESFDATSESFKRLNTNKAWADASQQARVPLGAMLSRTLVSQESVPAPPAGVEVVKFRTRFANKAEAIEKVSLAREDGVWRVVGIYID